MNLRGAASGLLIAALVVSGAAFCSSCRSADNGQNGGMLVIRDADSGAVYGKWALDEPGEFAIEFMHSVNQSPVRESFRTEDGLIRPVSVRFSSFGAGMRSDLEEGQILTQNGDYLFISGFTVSFKELFYIIRTVSDHLLLINDYTISLRELCGKTTHIAIRVE